MSDQIFISKIKKGDEYAVRELVMSTRDVVFRTCLAYVQNTADAEDLTQEVYIKALGGIAKFKGESKISSWLVRIAIRLSINYLRDNKKRFNHLDLEKADVADFNEANLFKTAEVRKAVRKAIFALPDKQRKVFILSFYLQMSYKEIQEVTDDSISSIESLLFRARKKLKELLQEKYEEIIS